MSRIGRAPIEIPAGVTVTLGERVLPTIKRTDLSMVSAVR